MILESCAVLICNLKLYCCLRKYVNQNCWNAKSLTLDGVGTIVQPSLTASFHLIVCTISSCVKCKSFPRDLIFFGSSFWYLEQIRGNQISNFYLVHCSFTSMSHHLGGNYLFCTNQLSVGIFQWQGKGPETKWKGLYLTKDDPSWVIFFTRLSICCKVFARTACPTVKVLSFSRLDGWIGRKVGAFDKPVSQHVIFYGTYWFQKDSQV